MRECESPNGVCSVMSGGVEHGEDAHKAEGLIVELDSYTQCLISSLIENRGREMIVSYLIRS